MEITAKLRNAALSPQKGRLVADLVRNMKVARALDVLKFTPKKGAQLMHKLLQSAIANAENNIGADVDELKLSTVFVDAAPVLKRMSPRAKGRGDRIIKRRCHITIIVSDEV